jgi:hypothetical protein
MNSSSPTLHVLFVGLLLCLGSPWIAAAEDFDHSHGRFATVLSRFVNADGVDYAGLKAAPADLDAYLAEIAAVKRSDFDAWPREQRLSLLLNLYNARTLRLILDHHPISSIRKIGTLPGAAWRQLIVRFGGEVMSLDHLENKIIRPDYAEPRIHFALVCAAKGCPPLRTEPYTATKLTEQLDDQARQFLATEAKNRFDSSTSTLWLSPIFDWYEKDFTAVAGSLEMYVRPFLTDTARQAVDSAKKIRVRFTDYDWSLNTR